MVNKDLTINKKIEVVLGIRFLKFREISSKFVFVFLGLRGSNSCWIKIAQSFRNFCKVVFVYFSMLR